MHQTTKEVSQERLKQIVSYDAATGVFVWLLRGRGIRHGRRAGSVDKNGYRYIRIDGQWYLAQRLAWLYVNGTWPTRVLRFQDGNKDNCAIENLAYGEWDF